MKMPTYTAHLVAVGYRLELDGIAARCTVQECSGDRKQG